MQITELLTRSGEHPLLLQGPAGLLEAVLTVPETLEHAAVAFLGHPHSLQGGTMNNKVVTTMVRAFKELGIPSLRFNFRGVGQSAGVYNAGMGESEDMIFLAKLWEKEKKGDRLLFCGFSFGSYVAYRAAAQFEKSLLITIAPAIEHYDYREFNPIPHPWLIIQGQEDEVVSFSAVMDFAQEFSPALPLIEFLHTGHFFHGKLVELKAQLMAYLSAKLLDL